MAGDSSSFILFFQKEEVMSAQINELVTMRDVDGLFDVMEHNDDWMLQLDAAEGLLKLGERAGLDFLLNQQESDSQEVREYARSILDDPATRRQREDLEAETRRKRAENVKAARARVQKGRKVFRYQAVLLPAREVMGDFPEGEGVDIDSLNDFGLIGWEVVAILPRRAGANQDASYFLLRKEIGGDDITELDELQDSRP